MTGHLWALLCKSPSNNTKDWIYLFENTGTHTGRASLAITRWSKFNDEANPITRSFAENDRRSLAQQTDLQIVPWEMILGFITVAPALAPWKHCIECISWLQWSASRLYYRPPLLITALASEKNMLVGGCVKGGGDRAVIRGFTWK